MYEKTDKRDKRKPKMFDNTCGDCHIEGLRCIEFAVEASNQDNRNKCCCGHMKNMHKNAISQPAGNSRPYRATIFVPLFFL